MKKTLITQLCAKEKISENQFIEEISVVLKEEVLAKYNYSENGIIIEFIKGQKFMLQVKEL